MDNDPLLTDLIYNLKDKLKNSKGLKLFQFDTRAIEKFVPVPPESGSGGFKTIRLSDKLGILITDHKTGHLPVVVHGDIQSENFKFTFNLSKDPVRVIRNGSSKPKLINEFQTYVLSPNISFKLNIPPHNHQIWVSIVIAPDLLKQIFLSCDFDLPEQFLKAVNNYKKGETFFHECTYTPDIQLVLEQIMRCPYYGTLKRIYLEGKALELIAQRFKLLNSGPGSRYSSVALSKKDIEKFQEIRKVLLSNINNPPYITSISKELGLNITKLKAGSHAVFGMSIGNYIRNLRIEHARYLLEHEGLNVNEASIAVGYRNVSHFIRTFKKIYGFSPGLYLKMKNHGNR